MGAPAGARSGRRTRPWELLPPGTLSVGAGLAVLGVGSYAFLILAARALGPEEYGALSVMVAAVFLIPGIFLPWEQEVSRELSDRGVKGVGGRSVVWRAAVIGTAISAALVLAGALGESWLGSTFFNDDGVLVLGFLIAIPGYFATNFIEGVLSGNHRFGRYGFFLGAEATIRVVLCVVLVVVGTATAGPYGVVLGVAPLVALGPTLWRAHGLVEPGPPMPWRPLVTALLGLMAGSLLSLGLVNLPPLLVEVLAGPGESEEVGRFTAALVLARVPLFLFQAIQAALLPQLTSLASGRRFDEFVKLLTRLAVGLGGLAVVAAIGGWLVGPDLMAIVFGEDFRISGTTIGMLAAGSGAYMLASALGQGVIALGGTRQVVLAWGAGVAAMLAVVPFGSGVVERVQTAYVVGAVVATVGMVVLVRWRYRRGVHVEEGDLLEAVHDLPLEP